jgi:zinc transporter 1/2/3
MHAFLDFANPCVGELEYESTSMAISMGGAFISFLVDYAGIQWLAAKTKSHTLPYTSPTRSSAYFLPPHRDAKQQIDIYTMETSEPSNSDLVERSRIDKEKLSVMIMEGGIIFHSIRKCPKATLQSKTIHLI